jgi:hypothetical protein
MYWFIDHANIIYIVLGLMAIGFVTAWWMKQTKRRFLYLAVAPVACIGVLWLLTRTMVTDRQQIRNNVEAMRDAVLAQDADALFRHVAADFAYKGMNRKQMYDSVARNIRRGRVQNAAISAFSVDEVSGPAGKARASFRVRVDDDGGNTVFFRRCEADFVFEDEKWKLRGIEFFDAFVNQDQPVVIPLE